MQSTAEDLFVARDLGSRGSRDDLSDAAPASELTSAAMSVLAAIPAWWSARAAAAGLHGDWLDVRSALESAPPIEIVPGRPSEAITAHSSSEEVGLAYVDALDAATRSRHGRHYTPTHLAVRLWALARASLGRSDESAPLPGLVRDPACGAGALLLPPLREHLAATVNADPQLTLAGIPNLIEGRDLDPAAVWIANVVLAAELLPVLARVPESRRRPLPTLVRTADGLESDVRPAHAIVMNPPYGRVRLSDVERERFAHYVYGHPNLYGLFLGVASETLHPEGVVVALVPTSFASGRYFETLRSVLTKSVALQDIEFVHGRAGVFSGVLQETCLAVFTRRHPGTTRIARITGSEVDEVATVPTPANTKPWILPRDRAMARRTAAALGMPLTLADAGWGVSTGPLVWNRRRADLSARPGRSRFPVIWAADIDGGRLHRDRQRNTHRYLTSTTPDDQKVLLLTTPAVLVQRTTAPEQRRRLVSVALTPEALESWGGAVVVENHVNVIRPTRTDPSMTIETLERLLATETMDELIRNISGSVALSAYELESLPLPAADILEDWNRIRDSAQFETAVAAAYSDLGRIEVQ